MLKLVLPDQKYQSQITEMVLEWKQRGERIVPHSVERAGVEDFEKALLFFEAERKGHAVPGWVPATTLFAYEEERDIVVGAVNIRHQLIGDGHIGDGVRPSERGKGYATRMIALALEECRELGMKKVRMVCLKENVASARTIEKNGGVFDCEVAFESGDVDRRYWIDL